MPRRRIGFIAPLVLLTLSQAGVAQTVPLIQFEQETLANGLRVIYAPMKNAPVVHVRVLYHVGSRDETPDRQGFAHMFEHMMFRGSAHVPPEQHMKLIGIVGGDSNAFTSFDQTTYTNTLPAGNTEMALYLEADRMASFKVNDEIFQTERKVVAEEWRMRYANQPAGPMMQDLVKTAFKEHSYRWTPIGDMDQLRQASSAELQEFFNTYYIPNNACLIVAGDIDVAQTKQWVAKYFGWIPKGPDIVRRAKPEPAQTEPRQLIVEKAGLPQTNMNMAYKTVGYTSDDHLALGLLGDVLSSGRTGRLDAALVNNEKPLCIRVGAGNWQLEDPAMFLITAVLQQNADPAAVQAEVEKQIALLIEKGITQAELDKVRTQMIQSVIRDRQECDNIASQLGEEAVFGGDPNRVNSELEKLKKVTPEQVVAAAKKYLVPQGVTVVQYRPKSADPATQQAAAEDKAEATSNAGVAPSAKIVEPRVKDFPVDYPTKPPVNQEVPAVVFNKGVEANVGNVKVVTLSDHRLPLVNVSVILRAGGDVEPAGKEGLADLTAAMLRRGSAGKSYLEFAADLESRGITVEVEDRDDNTRLGIACMADQLDYAVQRAVEVLNKPNFDAGEFDRLKRQALGGLMQSLSRPETVAERALKATVFAGSTLGRVTTPQSLQSITLEDVKQWYASAYRRENAVIIVSGDIKPEQGSAIAEKLIDSIPAPTQAAAPKADYTLPPIAEKRKVIVVDNPQGKQATIRFGVQAYDIKNEDKFSGSVAGQILSAGIESRLNKYVRAEKGLTYGCYAYFRPGRHGGQFSGAVDTNIETAADAVEAMLKVFNDMKTADVEPQELLDARSRVAGDMLMETQTIAQQAGRRSDQILNDYPIDYYDKYPERIGQVTARQVRDVMNTYVKDDKFAIIVVAPAEQVKEQLKRLGDVKVVPMPLKK